MPRLSPPAEAETRTAFMMSESQDAQSCSFDLPEEDRVRKPADQTPPYVSMDYGELLRILNNSGESSVDGSFKLQV